MKVIITDNRDYVPEKSCNGGHYSYWTVYREIGTDYFEISYYTSAEFDYCECCGRFGCHDCDPSENSSYDHVTEAELKKIIAEAEAKDGFEVEIIE